MTWAMLWVENADVVGTFDTRELAQASLSVFVAEHPEIKGQVAVVEIDARGRAAWTSEIY